MAGNPQDTKTDMGLASALGKWWSGKPTPPTPYSMRVGDAARSLGFKGVVYKGGKLTPEALQFFQKVGLDPRSFKTKKGPGGYNFQYVDMTNRPTDATFRRQGRSPYVSGSEIAANIWQNTHPLDFVRDLTKGVYEAGKTLVTDPGAVWEGTKNAAGALRKLRAANVLADNETAEGFKEFYDTAWNAVKGQKGDRHQNAQNWMKQATDLHNKAQSFFVYYDEKGNRNIDTAAMARTLTQRPMEVLSLLTPVGEAAGAKLATSGNKLLSATGKVLETGSQAANVAFNAAPAAIGWVAKTTPVRTVVDNTLRKLGFRARVFDRNGALTPDAQRAFDEAGIDPVLFDSPQGRTHIEGVIREKGLSPATIREGVLTGEGIRPTRSAVTGERPLQGNIELEGQVRTAGRQQLSANMEQYVDDAYRRATSHTGVFTNANDFTSGVRQSIEDRLSQIGLSLADIQNNPRFAKAREALFGSRNTSGVFQQFDDLSGSQPPAPLVANDLSGVSHTYDYTNNRWVDPAGNPVTAPAKIQYLDAASNRPNLPPPVTGQNRLTGQNIDSVRRNVSYTGQGAQGDDVAALGAIKGGIDDYTLANARNFSGDGTALYEDWANARRARQIASGETALVDISPNPQIAADYRSMDRAQAARGILNEPPLLENTAVPTIWQNLKRYVPSVGVGSTVGYGVGRATGLPFADWVGGMAGGAATAKVRSVLDDLNRTKALQEEFAGAPRALWQAPELRNPVTVAGSINQIAQAEHPVQVEQEYKPPVQSAQPPALPATISQEDYDKSLSPTPTGVTGLPAALSEEEYQKSLEGMPPTISESEYQSSLQPQPQYRGGRTAYKSGGKVQGANIEPLIRALINKAKAAKKVSNKSTEPLLNEHDDAVASALAVAQKAI